MPRCNITFVRMGRNGSTAPRVYQTRKGRCSTLNCCMFLSLNKLRFKETCSKRATRPKIGRQEFFSATAGKRPASVATLIRPSTTTSAAKVGGTCRSEGPPSRQFQTKPTFFRYLSPKSSMPSAMSLPPAIWKKL
ncbi:hypothetical protein EHS39_07765 [Ensifer sp. MPMI2T]|nr:hypothetical protein EHS39_07765 [Ensifer sp. MPMI2T]